MKKVVIAGKLNPEAERLFTEQIPDGFNAVVINKKNPEKELVLKEIPDAEYLIVRGSVPADREVLDAAKNLKLIQKWGAGYDQYDMELIGSYNIPFLNCAGVNSVQVSELTIGLILAAYRYIPQLNELMKQGKRMKEEFLNDCHTINGKLVGIVGIGNIGRRVASLVQAFGATVQYYDAFRLSPEAEKELNVTNVDLETLFRTSDIISLHAPLLPETEYMVNKDTLRLMKSSALLVNAARGKLVRSNDLYEALSNGTIAGAALDVLEEDSDEGKISPLLGLKNVVATPHMGASTAEVTQDMVTRCYENVLKIDRDEVKDPKAFLNGAYFK